MTLADDKPTIRCDCCRVERKTSTTAKGIRIPMGWKRHQDTIYCGDCWKDRYVLRAVSLPIVGPADGEWKELRACLSGAWGDSTSLHNWALSTLYQRDMEATVLPARREGKAKLPPMAKCYLYPEARELFPAIPSVSVASMLQAVEKRYRAARYEVCWTGASSLPNYRYPAPFSAPNQSWSAEYDESQRPVVSVRIGEQRWLLRLRGGARRRRQLGSFRQIVSGEAVKGEIAIYRKRAGETSNDGGVRDRENGQRVSYDVFVKMVAWLPRPTQADRGRTGSLFLRTAQDALMVAVDTEGERIWTLHHDHVRRWQAEHAKRLQALSDDQKAEQRPDPSFGARRAALIEKQHRRMDTAIKEAARQIANYARRRRVAEVVLDDTERRFAASFPWHALKSRLTTVLDEFKIPLRERPSDAA